MTVPACRFCRAPLTQTFLDLGEQPLANSYLTKAQLDAGNEGFYPLHTRVCGTCFLVQADDPVAADAIFDEGYAYFSSYSESWVAHAKRYAQAMVERLGLGPQSLVIEVASNDGYLLQHFKAMGVPVHTLLGGLLFAREDAPLDLPDEGPRDRGSADKGGARPDRCKPERESQAKCEHGHPSQCTRFVAPPVEPRDPGRAPGKPHRGQPARPVGHQEPGADPGRESDREPGSALVTGALQKPLARVGETGQSPGALPRALRCSIGGRIGLPQWHERRIARRHDLLWKGSKTRWQAKPGPVPRHRS